MERYFKNKNKTKPRALPSLHRLGGKHLNLSVVKPLVFRECLLVRQQKCEAQVRKRRLEKVKNVSMIFGLVTAEGGHRSLTLFESVPFLLFLVTMPALQFAPATL